ncbi:hypothetical protein G9A89_020965 [Geosiphon pyriformis]|nr:hypothetical protein G9A89_020965 [Geosiphon pyriformis]
MEMATLLARKKGININSNLKRQGMRSDQTMVIKEILMNTLKDMIVAAVSEFGKIKSIKIQLIGMWQKAVVDKDSVHIVKAVGDHKTWASRDQFRALLFTLLVGMTAHDLGTLLEKTGEKTCIINRSLETGNRICCAVVGFESDDNLESAFHTELILGEVKLSWAKMDLVWCEKCKKFDHSALKCDVSVASLFEPLRIFKKIAFDGHCLQLAKLYEKKGVSISCPAVVLLAGPSDGPHFSSGSSSSLSLSGASDSNIGSPLTSDNNSSLNAHLATLECSLELLMNQVSGILKKLGGIELVLMAIPSSVSSLATLLSLVLYLDVDMAVDNMLLASAPPLSAVDDVVHDSSLSFFKVLTSKVGGLELKIVAFEVLISLVLERLNHLCSGVVAMCNVKGMNNPAKQEDIVRWHKNINNLVSIFMETKLRNKTCSWLIDKFDDVCMFSFGLDSGYVGAGVAIVMNRFLTKHVYKISEANKINSLIARAMNKSSFVILGGDFNKDGSHKCASFKNNSWGVAKTIDYVFVSSNLVNAIMQYNVFVVSKHFDTDYKAVSVSLGLGGADEIKWNNFKSSMLINAILFLGEFTASVRFSDLDTMWCVVCKVMTLLANKIFKKRWFKGFDEVFTKDFSKFHKLKLLVSRIVKTFHEKDAENFVYLMECWSFINNVKSSVRAKKAYIRSVIDKRIESFKINKDHTIRSVLERLFHKVVLDHLVVNDNLILESDLVKFKVDVIMEGWTKKHYVVDDISIDWCHQYQLLEYVFDKAFSGVMCLIGFNKFFGVISDFPDDKTAGLSGISNELWKHCNKSVLDMFLVILNLCLSGKLVPGSWKEA